MVVICLSLHSFFLLRSYQPLCPVRTRRGVRTTPWGWGGYPYRSPLVRGRYAKGVDCGVGSLWEGRSPLLGVSGGLPPVGCWGGAPRVGMGGACSSHAFGYPVYITYEYMFPRECLLRNIEILLMLSRSFPTSRPSYLPDPWDARTTFRASAMLPGVHPVDSVATPDLWSLLAPVRHMCF